MSLLKKKLLTDKSGQLYEEQLSIAAQHLADEIDFQILSEMLCSTGWTKVVLKPMTWEQSAEIDLWVMKNIKQLHHTMGLVWIFENASESNWFTMRWL